MAETSHRQERKYDLDKPLYNSRLIDTYIKYLRTHYSHINIAELLAYANIESYQVADENHWFSQRQVNSFHEKLLMLTGNKEIARHVGRFAASPGVLGIIRRYAVGLIGPARAYEMLGKYTRNLTRSSTFHTTVLGRNKVKITVTPREDAREMPFQCENRKGYLEAVAAIFNKKLPTMHHEECIFNGNEACTYLISWEDSKSALLKKVRNYSAAIFTGALLASFIVTPSLAVLKMLPLMLIVIMGMSLLSARIDYRELEHANTNLRQSADELLVQANQYYNKALTLNEIATSLIQESNVDSVLDRVIELIKEHLPYDRGLILLANENRTRLIFQSGFGYEPKHEQLIQNTFFRLDKKDGQGVFTVSFKEKKPFLINSLDDIKDSISPRSLEFAKQLGAKSFICCPIIFENESLGILAIDNINHNTPLLQSDVNFLMTVTHTIGISINNVLLFRNKERQLRSIISAMASTIDARDPLTSGHSERVTEYSVGIARELGLPDETVEMIRVASLLHDYGKIGIKDSILLKKGQLTNIERMEIKTHTDKTRQILEEVNFDGIYSQVPEIAGAHHERYDGSGYPKGLKGDEIPLGARILAVADFFEAITSQRHYRDPMPTTDALDMLKRLRNKDFEDVIVDAFIRFYESTYCRLN